MTLYDLKYLAVGATALVGLIGPGIAESQDLSCPAQHVCVDYHGTAIAIDPKQGPVQGLIVREDATTSTTFEGTASSETAVLAVYVSNGDTYDLDSEQTVDQDGIFETATLGDVYVLTKVIDAN